MVETCASGGLVLLALSLRFAASTRLWILDSLSANAYSIYLAHYVFVVWLQYALLGSGLPVVFVPLAKPVIVLACALLMSWACSVAFNRLVTSQPIVSHKRAFARITH